MPRRGPSVAERNSRTAAPRDSAPPPAGTTVAPWPFASSRPAKAAPSPSRLSNTNQRPASAFAPFDGGGIQRLQRPGQLVTPIRKRSGQPAGQPVARHAPHPHALQLRQHASRSLEELNVAQHHVPLDFPDRRRAPHFPRGMIVQLEPLHAHGQVSVDSLAGAGQHGCRKLEARCRAFPDESDSHPACPRRVRGATRPSASLPLIQWQELQSNAGPNSRPDLRRASTTHCASRGSPLKRAALRFHVVGSRGRLGGRFQPPGGQRGERRLRLGVGIGHAGRYGTTPRGGHRA